MGREDEAEEVTDVFSFVNVVALWDLLAGGVEVDEAGTDCEVVFDGTETGLDTSLTVLLEATTWSGLEKDGVETVVALEL